MKDKDTKKEGRLNIFLEHPRLTGTSIISRLKSQQVIQQRRPFSTAIILTSVVMLIGMTAYEWTKMLFLPEMTIWESHLITIIFSAFVAIVAIYFMMCRHHELLRQTVEENIAWQQAEEILHEYVHFLQELIDSIPNPIFYKDEDGTYQGCNKAFEDYLGLAKEKIIGKTDDDVGPRELAGRHREMDLALLSEPGVRVYEASLRHADGTEREVIFNKATYTRPDGSSGGLVGVMLDITERKKSERERERLICELREALAQIKTLRGLLPICAWCKKIRDDQGYWNRIESYISDHSLAEFTHSVCPECAKKVRIDSA